LGEQAERLDQWLAAGMDSGMEYMRRNMAKRLDPCVLVDGAKTVVVCAVNYKNMAWDQRGQGMKIASYSYAPDYHVRIKRMLNVVLECISREYPGVKGRLFCDTAPLLEKSWAVEAGLGWIGKNSLLVTSQYGSFVLLGEIVINAECDVYDEPYVDEDDCGSCTRCMEVCPGEAIVAPRTIDTRRCIARLLNERMPEGVEMPQGMQHGWLHGCDECQSCCPHNQNTPYCDNPAFAPVADISLITDEFWRALSESDFYRIFGNTSLTRTGFEAIKSRIDAK
jgi:epoxyqueuosine reductase